MELVRCKPNCWHQKLSLRERKDAELLMLFRIDKVLAKQISETVCARFNLPKVKISFLSEDPNDFGIYSDNVIELYGPGQNAECLTHELAHHLAESRRDKQKHGKKFVQAYRDLILVVKKYLKEKDNE